MTIKRPVVSPAQCRAARAIAAEFFDPARVLAPILALAR